MIIDFRQLEDGAETACDICIIGAGAAGISLARSLIDSKLQVCVLESGGFEFDQEIQSLYRGPATGVHYVDLHAARLRYFGGSTNHWGGWCGPLDEEDFEARPWVPYSGWPISRQDLEPYYPLAQTLCELGPYPYDTAAWEGENRDYPDFDPGKLTTGLWQLSPPTRFGAAYRRDLELAGNVSVYLYANVVELEAGDDGRSVQRVLIRTPWGKRGAVRARYYVLACGGIENARMLLLSRGVVPPGLGNQAGMVGRFFMDHPTILHAAHLQTFRPDSVAALFEPVSRNGRRALACLRPSVVAQRSRRILNGSTTFRKAPRAEVRDELSRSVSALVASSAGGPDSEPQWFDVVTRTEQAPDPGSRITLSDDKDALGLNRPALHLRLTELDADTIRTTLTLVGEELGRLGLGRVRLNDRLDKAPDSWPDTLIWSCHHMGTTRMSANPKLGVVDSNCRMHTVDNLYVAGSSTFSTSGYMNPTLTIVALALRLGDHLVARASK